MELVFNYRRFDLMSLKKQTKKLLKTGKVAAILERNGDVTDFLEFLG